MSTLRPADLAREHGISTQAVRNYEQDGFIPPADRTASGYRIYTEVHVVALRAYLALVPAYGRAAGGQIMNALHRGELDDVLTNIDRSHTQLLRDRETLDSVRRAVTHLTAKADAMPDLSEAAEALTIGELAHRLRVTAATLRTWENVGILAPTRDSSTGYRHYRPGDVRDAELAHLLRRGDYPLNYISTVVQQIRTAGGTAALAATLGDWQRKLTAQGLAMLRAASQLSHYLNLLEQLPTNPGITQGICGARPNAATSG